MVVVSFWGKGGVGKTTLTASLGLAYSEKGCNTLVVTVDPTPTLNLVLGLKEVGTGKPIRVRDNLWLLSITSDDARRLWLKRFGDEVYSVVGSLVEGISKEELLNYLASAPGVVDEFMLYLVYKYHVDGGYDAIVWDTPAAGGSLRLLRLEYEFYSHLSQAVKLYLRLRGVFDKVRKGLGKDVLQIVDEWRGLAKELIDFISSESHRPVLVLSNDSLSATVARDLAKALESLGSRIYGVIVNMFIDENLCPHCSLVEELSNRSLNVLAEARDISANVLCIVPYVEAETSIKRVEKIAEIILDKCRELL